jgi:hypothetical protein
MANPKNSAQAFNEAVRPFFEHKTAYTAEKGFTGETTEGGVPQSIERQKIMEGRQAIDTVLDVPMAAIGSAWNIPFGKTGWRYGKDNWILQSKADKELRKTELANARNYRERRDRVRDDILEIANAAKLKYEATGDNKFLDLATQATNDLLANEGLTPENDYVILTPEVQDLRDGIGLFTNNPNPYPAVEASMYIGGGIAGSVKGEKLVRDKFLKGAAKSFAKSKGNWLARSIGAVTGGALAVGVADYGYEGMLDLMDRAGKAKGYMRDPNQQASLVDAALASVVPDALTFGPQGINRPEQMERIKNATSAAIWDAGLTAGFFALRPAYYGIRRTIGGTPFGMFKQKPSRAPGVVSGKEILEGEQRILERWMPSQSELDQVATKGLKQPKEKLSYNMPFGLGNFLFRLSNSKAFNWLGPRDPIKPGTNEWFPEATEIGGTMVARTSVGGAFGGRIAGMLSPAPIFGISIKNNMAKQSDFYIDGVMRKMIGAFAPYAHLDEMVDDFSFLASKNYRGFVAQAKQLEDDFVKAAEGMGKGFSDENLVNVAKQTLREYDLKLQRDPSGNIIPSEVRDKLINVLKNQIIKPVGEGRTHGLRDVYQMKGLREQIDDLLAPLKDKTLAETSYADDISRLMKAWENDVASIERMGYPDVAKAFDAYDKFVSSGLMLYGTNVGKAAAGGEVSKRGFGVVLNQSTTRASHSLWDTVIKSARAGNLNSKQEIQALRRIVGDRGYVNGLGVYIRDSFDAAIKDKEGVQFFDAAAFRDSLGIGTTGALNRLFKEALPGPTVSKLEIFDPATGIFKKFDDEIYETGVNKGIKDILGEEVPEGMTKTNATRLPTLAEFDDLTRVLEKLFENGVPSGSKYMMRRATMSGTRGAARALLPSTAIGKGIVSKGGAEAGVAMLGPIVASVTAFLVNYGGKVLTNPVAIKVLKNLTDENLPSTIRQANFARLVRMYPEEFAAYDADLAEMEQVQKEYNRNSRVAQNAKSIRSKVMEGVGDVIKQAPSVPGKIFNSPLNPNVLDLLPNQSPPTGVPEFAPEAPDASVGGYDSASAGSVINRNQNFNPAAAGALYTGNTDAALAAQYGGGTQYAAGGGLMEMNPVMNNQGKYTKPQRGMNDNPFVKKGIGSLV